MSNLSKLTQGDTTALRTKADTWVDALNGIGGDLLDSGHIYQGADGPGLDAPYLRSKDSGGSGIDFRWLNDAGVLALQLNTGTEAVPVWETAFTIDLTNRKFSVGDAASTTLGALHILDGGADNKPGLLALYDDAGNDYYLWVSTAGDIRFHTSAPADDDADGTVIGSATKGGVTNGDSHDHVGGDGAAITESAITLADNTTNDSSTSKHGFLKKLDNTATNYMNGQGAWSNPLRFYHEVNLLSAKLPASNAALLDNGNTQERILFDDTADESVSWGFALDKRYQGGTLNCALWFSMVSATGATQVVLNAYLWCLTSGDAGDVDTESYDSANTTTTSCPSSAGMNKRVSIALANADSAAQSDMCRIKVEREGSNGSDNAGGDLELRRVVVWES